MPESRALENNYNNNNLKKNNFLPVKIVLLHAVDDNRLINCKHACLTLRSYEMQFREGMNEFLKRIEDLCFYYIMFRWKKNVLIKVISHLRDFFLHTVYTRWFFSFYHKPDGNNNILVKHQEFSICCFFLVFLTTAPS